MRNKIISLSLIVMLFSCVKSKQADIIYTEIKNEELKKQICIYINYIDSIEPNKEKLIVIEFKKINDSTMYLDISNDIYQQNLKRCLNFNFICKIKNRDILFTDNATRLKNYFDNYFILDSLVRETIIKRNFSHEYKKNDADKNGIVIEYNYDPYDFHLILVNGRLVSKSVEIGRMF